VLFRPFRLVLCLAAALAPVLLLPVAVAAAPQYPAHVGKVNDFAAVLSAEQVAALEAALADLERTTTAEVAVVTVDGTDGVSIEEYATGLFNNWGIGKADRDNGVLVLVSPPDRALRIEVGYGLEPILPDGFSGAIIRETFLPRFRDGDLAGGLVAGTTRVIDVVRRNEIVTPEQREAYDRAARDAGTSWGMAAFLSLFVMLGAFVSGTGVGAKVVFQVLFGCAFMVVGLFLALVAAPRQSHPLLLALALGVGWAGVRLGRRPAWRKSLGGTGRAAGGTGWTMGASGASSGRSSGSTSSGGFSGGSSGGGGASGRW